MLELSIVYGLNENDTRKVREMRGGRFLADVINGKEWPPSGSYACIQNQPLQGETRCHNIPVIGAQIIMGGSVMYLWFYRMHNAVARELQSMNPCWDDEKLFYEAREIVIAFVNQIWYYELYPAVLGYDYLLKNKAIYSTWGHINDYNPKLEPAVSIEYVVGTRWFHTVQEGRSKLYDRDGKLINELDSVELTLRTGILPLNRTIQGLTQGYFRQATAAEDYIIDPDMGERVLGSLQTASDVYSSDIMKGRDDGLPAYNKYRQICNLPVAKDFEDLRQWMPDDKVDAMIQHYETVDDIDIVAGFTSEYPMKEAAFGPTLACMMTDQIKHWRQADRFWYENQQHPGAFTEEQLYQIRHMTMSRVICDHGDEVDTIQPWSFFLAGPG
ncbi:peroxidase-like [Pectinophora gossypiella]|uniref:peroxidase-like n=1 Tax=Pectinophora gossypiella TaxID=13191 RepID=UPI00214EC825|nr:peroxidase-like [Pectinophora gossypiella]